MNNIKKLSPKLIWVFLVLSLLALACRVAVPDDTTSEPVRTVVVTVEVPSGNASTSQGQPSGGPVQLVEDDTALVNLYAAVNPSVVNITIYNNRDGQFIPEGQGSGFVYDSEGHIITNAHVVHGADQIEVTFSEGTTRLAELVGEDLNSDLAVVKVELLPGLQPLPLGDMETLAVGQTVVAIGNPFGLQGTLTRGVISALGRTIPALTPFSIPQSIQTDAAINPGNSGGPLLNLKGEVIGVNAQIETDGVSRSNLGVGFAIPVSIVKVVVPDLIEKGEHEWAWLGVRGGSVTPLLVQAMELPFEKGAYLAEVLPNGPSDQADLRGSSDSVTIDGRTVEVGGDIITAINGQPVTSFDDLLIFIALNAKPGDAVTLTIWRDGKYMDVTVNLEKRPDSISSLGAAG